jgi:hypothetical protein
MFSGERAARDRKKIIFNQNPFLIPLVIIVNQSVFILYLYNIYNMKNNNVLCVPGRKKASVRQYFDEKNDKLICNINSCKKIFSKSTSVTSLKCHAYKEHNAHVSDNNNINNNNVSSNIIMSKQELESQKNYEAIAIAFAKNSLSLSLIENKHYRRQLEILHGKEINITKKKLKETIISEGKRINDNMLSTLSSDGQPITIALDGWTNVRANKVTNILLICSGSVYYYAGIENKNDFNNVEWLVPKLTEAIGCIN